MVSYPAKAAAAAAAAGTLAFTQPPAISQSAFVIARHRTTTCAAAAVGLVYWPINNNAIFSLFQQHKMDPALPNEAAVAAAASHHHRQWLHHPNHSHSHSPLALPAGHHHLVTQPVPGHPAFRDQQGRRLGRDSVGMNVLFKCPKCHSPNKG